MAITLEDVANVTTPELATYYGDVTDTNFSLTQQSVTSPLDFAYNFLQTYMVAPVASAVASVASSASNALSSVVDPIKNVILLIVEVVIVIFLVFLVLNLL